MLIISSLLARQDENSSILETFVQDRSAMTVFAAVLLVRAADGNAEYATLC